MKRIYRGRFAPSPTGPLHFGSLVAAIGSYLDAKAHGGVWLVRMDDLDLSRTVPGAADLILRSLESLGMAWDEPVVYQSKRSAAYEAALKVLKKRKLIYPCACSRREIADSAVGGLDGPIYSGTCRKGLLAGRAARADRVITDNTRIELKDVIQGKIVHSLERQVGDFVVKRADGYYAYQLAAVVDDAAQGITDVVRGADLLDSTTRQIYLQQMLGYTTPRYAHLPVAVNVLGEKLSKQTLAAPIDNRELLATLNAALAFLGQDTITDADPKKMADFWKRAIAGWGLARVPRQRTQPAPV